MARVFLVFVVLAGTHCAWAITTGQVAEISALISAQIPNVRDTSSLLLASQCFFIVRSRYKVASYCTVELHAHAAALTKTGVLS